VLQKLIDPPPQHSESGVCVHCGEEPEVRAQHFHVIDDSVESSSAEFYWDEVDDDPLQVAGIFRGYQVSRRSPLASMLYQGKHIPFTELLDCYKHCFSHTSTE